MIPVPLIAFPTNRASFNKRNCCSEALPSVSRLLFHFAARTQYGCKRSVKMRELVRIHHRIGNRVAVLQKFDNANSLPRWNNLWLYVRDQGECEERKPSNHEQGDHYDHCLGNTDLFTKTPFKSVRVLCPVFAKGYHHSCLCDAENKQWNKEKKYHDSHVERPW